MNYRDIPGHLDREHVYDLFWRGYSDRDGMNSGEVLSLSRKELLSRISKLEKFGDLLEIMPRTTRLGMVRREEVDAEHADIRRFIYDPEKILAGLKGTWFPHSILTVMQSNSLLGGHQHNYDEAFFVPSGQFRFSLVDPREPNNPRNYGIFTGNRIFIPAYIDHVVIGNKGSVLMGYGTVKYNPNRTTVTEREVLKILQGEAKR